MPAMVCPAWLGHLLASPVRKLIQPPERILSPYVKEGMTVLDIGPAMGFFTIPLARMVGTNGKVIAVDMQEKMLRGLKKRAQRTGLLTRIEARLCSQETLGLQDLAAKIDFALVFAVVHEVPDPSRFFAELSAAIKPSGSVLLSEPNGHVSEEEFTITTSLAKQHEFEIVEVPKIFRSRSALLRKAKLH